MAALCPSHLICAVKERDQSSYAVLFRVALRMDETPRRSPQVEDEGDPVRPPLLINNARIHWMRSNSRTISIDLLSTNRARKHHTIMVLRLRTVKGARGHIQGT